MEQLLSTGSKFKIYDGERGYFGLFIISKISEKNCFYRMIENRDGVKTERSRNDWNGWNTVKKLINSKVFVPI